MTIPETVDVVVIGGGPAGSMTATFLAKSGYQVALFEKQVHPRYVVGESLIPLFWKYTDAAGVSEKIESEGFITKAGGTVNWKGQIHAHSFKALGYDRPALHVERDRFDHILLKNASEKGALVYEGVSVTGVNLDRPEMPVVRYRDKSGDSGQTSCRFVVDASGQSAFLGRQLGLRKVDPGFRYMSVWGYFTGSRFVAYGGKVHPPEDLTKVSPTTFITSLKTYDDVGWSWHIPMRKETSVGFVVPVAALKAERGEDEDWEAFFLRRCEETDNLRELLRDASFVPGSVRLIRNYSYQSDRYTGPGYFLIGDAASFIDPIFSVGVVLAMYSGYAVAWAVEQCLKHPDSTERYQRLFQNQMQARIEVSRALALPSYDPSGEVSDMVRSSVQFESGQSKDLMSVVTLLTSRSENFKSMVGKEHERSLPSDAYMRLDRLEFDG